MSELHDTHLRHLIRSAAAAEFARHGFAETSLDGIAARSGTDVATVRRLAGDLATVYAGVLLDALAEALARVAPAVAAARSPEARLRAGVTGIALAAENNPHFSPLLLREIASGGASLPTPAVAHMQLLFRTLTHTLSLGAAGGVFRPVDPLVTQMVLAGSLLVIFAGAPIAARLRPEQRPPLSPTLLATAVSDLLLDGLRPHPKPPHRSAEGEVR